MTSCSMAAIDEKTCLLIISCHSYGAGPRTGLRCECGGAEGTRPPQSAWRTQPTWSLSCTRPGRRVQGQGREHACSSDSEASSPAMCSAVPCDCAGLCAIAIVSVEAKVNPNLYLAARESAEFVHLGGQLSNRLVWCLEAAVDDIHAVRVWLC